MVFVRMLVASSHRPPLETSQTSRSSGSDDEANRRAIGAAFHVDLIGNALHEGHPQTGLVTETLGSLHVRQVWYGVEVEPRTMIDHLDQHPVLSHLTADNDPISGTNRTLSLDGVGGCLGHDKTEIGHPSGP